MMTVRRYRRAVFLCVALLLSAVSLWAGVPAAGADTGDPVTYFGGPVAHSTTGVIVDWGSSINSIYTNATTGDPGLIKYLASMSGSTSDLGGVLAQYVDTTSHNAANSVTYGGQYAITPSVTSTTLQDSDVQNELVNQINAGHLPTPSGDGLSTIYLVLFPAGDQVCLPDGTCSGTDFCAYHGSTTLTNGTNVLYLVLPDNTSGAMTQGCGSEATPLQDQTSYTTAEWYDTVSDPLVADADSYGPPLGWYDSNCPNADSVCGEIGDKCNQQTAVEGGFTVQVEYSDLDAACESSEPAYSQPTATYTPPSGGTAGQSVSFSGSGSTDPPADHASASYNGTTYSINSGIASYDWNWGDGTSDGSGATASHTFAESGTYEVSLTVADNLGFTSTVTKQVSIATPAQPPPAPVPVTGSASNIDDQGGTLAGTINPEGQAVTYQFAYGPSASNLDQATTLVGGLSGSTATPVSAVLSDLNASTTYYFELRVITGGQTYQGLVQSFTTADAPVPPPPPPPPPPQNPVAGTGGASGVTLGSATIAGTVDPGGSSAVFYEFVYGTSAGALSQNTGLTEQPGATSAVPVSAGLTGLLPGTTYYYRLDVTLDDTTVLGTAQSFTTQTPVASVQTGAASGLTSAQAIVGGTVDPNGFATTYHFEYGTTTSYGLSSAPESAGDGESPVSVTATLVGLQPGTLYHYRLVATGAGGTVVGPDQTVRTSAPPAAAPHLSFWLARGQSLRSALTHHLVVHFRCSKACVVRFSVTVLLTSSDRQKATPVTLARGVGRLNHAGTGKARLSFTTSARGRLLHGGLRRSGATKLELNGYAVGTGGSSTQSESTTFKLSRR
jgi:hypothetical protein